MPFPAVIAGAIALSPIVVPLVMRAAFALGFGVVTYVGLGLALDQVEDGIYNNLGATSAHILTILGMAKVDVAIKTVLAAVTTKLGLMGMNAAGNLLRPRWRFND
jgi:hypothetical protein